ncbi:class I SAM-dependent methyltransferase [Undibacterium rugosum]|uniref:Methyltransferase domain-containing protein n=1 Tax=Undibacterium rugosum TaxID=2762291 RepID=A0A923I7B9_9BURK|nr:class I SAM-dependent methyltransferase [Undibacterium rugosum]MBC3934903.1 methyltransferase domain-containing protein [Undibacterium rugosum]MBR7778236.1 methyltransferase domain-containing protein [Undibacterium rugosum]
MNCRHCGQALTHTFLDLGTAPPSNAYLSAQQLQQAETWLPLRLMVCEQCWLVQTLDFTGRENLFDADYAYFSSCSSSWLAHAQRFVQDMQQRLRLNADSHVVEVAANDGYLLQYVQQAGIPCLGIEPTASTAAAARDKGLTIREEFFGLALAKQLCGEAQSADLTVANNVLAHVPDMNDFVAGFTALLKPHGVASFEFPHLLNMVSLNQFDTAYHEHFSYLSLLAVERIFSSQGLTVFDVEQLPTHGGSLRVLAQRSDTGQRERSERVEALLQQEREAGVDRLAFYRKAQLRAENTKYALLKFLIASREQGVKVAAYGAAAKGNTLLNFAGVRPDLLPYVVDINPHKQGKCMPGSRIPIVHLDHLIQDRPDFVLILPWNLEQEISADLHMVCNWGGRLVFAIPEWKIV